MSALFTSLLAAFTLFTVTGVAVLAFAAIIAVLYALNPVGAWVFILYVLGLPAAYALYHLPGDFRDFMEQYQWMRDD